MEVRYDDVKNQVDSLPISYYARRKVPTLMDKDAECSYYNGEADEIHISYNQVAQGLSSAVDEEETYKETAIRSMVYHELSHTILTPNILMREGMFERYLPYGIPDRKNTEKWFDVFNIFEDERIETIFKDFYLNVNFKKNILYVNGGKITQAQDARTAFYNLVRYRVHNDKALLQEVEDIINNFSNINANTKDYLLANYMRKVVELYLKVEEDFQDNQDQTSDSDRQNAENSINQEGNGSGYDENNVDGSAPQNGKDSKDGQNGQTAQSGQNGQDEQDGQGSQDGQTAQNGQNGQKVASGQKAGRGEVIHEIFDSTLNKYHDTQTTEMLKSIIDNFNKKNNNGNGTLGYSGIFNPRNIKNKDYKYFDRHVSAKGNNKFGKLHLNLFIDNSGSFENLAPTANSLVNSLAEIERKNPNFDFDLILCGSNLRDTTKGNRFVWADEGTYATYTEVMEKMKNHAKKDSYNYNIVMYDGDCDSYNDGKDAFEAWDRNNVAIIDTGENRRSLDKLKNARVVYSSWSELVKTLGKEVAKALQTAFR